MRRFLIMMTLLAALLLVARAAGADDTIEAPRLGPTTERPSFFDHGLWTDEAVRGSADRDRRRSADAPRVVDDRVRFTLRDYGYVAAWIETDAGDWRRIPMEYRPGADRWTIELDLPRGRTRYVFVVEDDEGRRRVRTDTANPRRRRDRGRGWVSEVEIDRRGRIVVEESRTPRRLRRERDTEVHLFDDVTVGYQRVDGFRLGFRPRVEPRDPWSPRFEGDFRYGFSSERWSSRLSLVQPLTVRGRARLHLAIFDRTDTIDRTGVGAFENSLATLVFREDAYDWWRSEGVRAYSNAVSAAASAAARSPSANRARASAVYPPAGVAGARAITRSAVATASAVAPVSAWVSARTASESTWAGSRRARAASRSG